jgi:hypothetical protein
MALAAARLIYFGRANKHDWIVCSRRPAVDQSLCAACFFPTDNTDCMKLIDQFRPSHQIRYGAKGHASKISVQTSAYDPFSLFSQPIADDDNIRIKELHFIYRHHSCVWRQIRKYLFGQLNWFGLKSQAIMRSDLFLMITSINLRLENLDLLSSDYRPPQAPDQFLGLTAEHAAADQFNTTS